MIFEETFLSLYFLLPEQISFSGCLYFVRYWAICVLQLFVKKPGCNIVKLDVNIIFLIK